MFIYKSFPAISVLHPNFVKLMVFHTQVDSNKQYTKMSKQQDIPYLRYVILEMHHLRGGANFYFHFFGYRWPASPSYCHHSWLQLRGTIAIPGQILMHDKHHQESSSCDPFCFQSFVGPVHFCSVVFITLLPAVS